ncbi:uncharacterized protein LOC135710623 [Ochlerotatus camptorhynchus]|uniref:uncharacterized protein LOC135710623 n=1 Tax=Ochlerotatus camptorhynchus TaxID=644619 RepID=UPI0031DF71BB
MWSASLTTSRLLSRSRCSCEDYTVVTGTRFPASATATRISDAAPTGAAASIAAAAVSAAAVSAATVSVAAVSAATGYPSPPKFVTRMTSTSLGVLLEELVANGLKPVQIHKMARHKKAVKYRDQLYLVHLEKNSTTLMDLQSICVLFNIVVKWDRYKPVSRGVTQCSNCLLFGHGTKNCSMVRRCIKCGKQHKTDTCDRLNEADPICANCGAAHKAISKARSAPNRHEKKRTLIILPSDFTCLQNAAIGNIQLLLRRGRVRPLKHSQTIHHAWNICFFFAAAIYLSLYHKLLIHPQIANQSSKYFPQYNNTIFLTACDVIKFEFVTMLLVAFDINGALARLKHGDYSEAISKFFYASLLICCFVLRLENYSVLLNLYLGIFNTIQEILLLFSLHTSEKGDSTLKLYVIFIFSSWSYLFLNILPFEFLIPTLYANSKELYLYLNLFFWLWYCSCIWNSPILKFLYHKIYHLQSNDCIGGESSVRCILFKDSPNYRNYRSVKQAYLELKLFYDKSKISGTRHRDGENSSTKVLQTIKCVLAVKRKLKRMRENRD